MMFKNLQDLDSESINIIYLDSPFYTQREQKLSDSKGKQYFFNDTWKSREEYLKYIEIRLQKMYRLLKLEDNIFLHCDVSASHYLRVLLDRIFGEKKFRSEIVWIYKR